MLIEFTGPIARLAHRALFLFCLFFPAVAACQAEDSRPNFLFIAIDDLNVYNSVLGDHESSFLRKVYPDSELRSEVVSRLTPNLDKLSQQGLVFEHAYTAAPLCGPSRTALLTGVPPHRSGYYAHDQHFRGYESLTDAVTLPQYLKSNGYFTSGIGKVFHKGRSYLDRGVFSDWPDQLFSWDEWVEVHSGTGTSHDSVIARSEQLSPYWNNAGTTRLNFTRFGVTNVPTEISNDYRNAMHIADLVVEGESAITDFRGQERNIKLPAGQPFFLAAGIFAPHLPWVVEQEYYDLFPQSEMAIDRALLDWIKAGLTDLPPTGERWTRETGFTRLLRYGLELDGEGGDINAWRAKFQAYLATVAYADRCIGVLLEAIEKNPRGDNTVVILWSDHGYHVGDHMREGKTTLWEAANLSNILVIDPRHPQSAGKRSQTPVSLQDLYPTVAGMAGLGRPSHVHGNNISPLLSDPAQSWDGAVLNTHGENNHAIRTANYRYIRYANGDQELYDMQADPFEAVNLARNPAHAALLGELGAELEALLARQPADYR